MPHQPPHARAPSRRLLAGETIADCECPAVMGGERCSGVSRVGVAQRLRNVQHVAGRHKGEHVVAAGVDHRAATDLPHHRLHHTEREVAQQVAQHPVGREPQGPPHTGERPPR